MNTTREIKQMDTGILVATLTPEEQATMDELTARRERVEAALWNAKRDAKKARQRVNILKKQLKIIHAKNWPLLKIRFPEL
jgi:predicted nucleic acid-binding protein